MGLNLVLLTWTGEGDGEVKTAVSKMQDKKEGCFDGPVVQREHSKEKNTKAGYLRDKTDQLTRGPP